MIRLAKKPGKSEFWLSIKVSLLGMLVIGMLGFIITLLANFIRSLFTGGA
jgi:protein translocase SEC61 complex gamma subunit